MTMIVSRSTLVPYADVEKAMKWWDEHGLLAAQSYDSPNTHWTLTYRIGERMDRWLGDDNMSMTATIVALWLDTRHC